MEYFQEKVNLIWFQNPASTQNALNDKYDVKTLCGPEFKKGKKEVEKRETFLVFVRGHEKMKIFSL